MTDSPEMPRRSFLGWILGLGTAVVGSVVGVAGGFLSNSLRRETGTSSVKVASLETLESSFKQFKVLKTTKDAWIPTERKYTLFLRKEGEKVVALSGKCSHLGCTVRWESDKNKFLCPCHDGYFDVNGNVLSGPPEEALSELPVRVEEGLVYVDLPEVS